MKLLVLCAVLAAATASVVKDDVFGFTITKDSLGKNIYFTLLIGKFWLFYEVEVEKLSDFKAFKITIIKLLHCNDM